MHIWQALLVLLLVLAVTGVMLSAITSALVADSMSLPAYLAADVAMAALHTAAMGSAVAWLAFGRSVCGRREVGCALGWRRLCPRDQKDAIMFGGTHCPNHTHCFSLSPVASINLV